jgi:hypothetical protein
MLTMELSTTTAEKALQEIKQGGPGIKAKSVEGERGHCAKITVAGIPVFDGAQNKYTTWLTKAEVEELYKLLKISGRLPHAMPPGYWQPDAQPRSGDKQKA